MSIFRSGRDIFYSYTQRRTYVIDEMVQLLWKLPFSKRALRAYHLLDEEQRQIQMVTALLIQLVHSSANLLEALKPTSSGSPIFEVLVDVSYLTKCHESVQDTCCHFWTRVLQRLVSVKTQDTSELKAMIENLVTDLLTTLNLPKYPVVVPVLEEGQVLDIKRISYWVNVDQSCPKDACSICLVGKVEKVLFRCRGCQRFFHADCMGVREQEVPNHSWYCQFCVCKKKLLVLRSYCESQNKDDKNKKYGCSENSESSNPIMKIEIVQKMLLNYLQDASSPNDIHLFVRWCVSLRKNSPVIRAKALRPVSIIVEADLEVLGDKCVQVAVEGRFCDSAISVREAALELVGRHIASHPDVGLKYFEKVAERIKDTGVSVRKRAIKIIRVMCNMNPNFSGFTSACIEIIYRVSDDESSIQFEEPSGVQTQYPGDGSSIPLEVAKKTEQIVEMLRQLPNHQFLVTVIKRNLVLDFFPQSVKAAGINRVSLAAERRRCEGCAIAYWKESCKWRK
ncbi:hypothetical protein CRYUN_Cryun15aG0040100 [Craigia yunnanensis]